MKIKKFFKKTTRYLTFAFLMGCNDFNSTEKEFNYSSVFKVSDNELAKQCKLCADGIDELRKFLGSADKSSMPYDLVSQDVRGRICVLEAAVDCESEDVDREVRDSQHSLSTYFHETTRAILKRMDTVLGEVIPFLEEKKGNPDNVFYRSPMDAFKKVIKVGYEKFNSQADASPSSKETNADKAKNAILDFQKAVLNDLIGKATVAIDSNPAKTNAQAYLKTLESPGIPATSEITFDEFDKRRRDLQNEILKADTKSEDKEGYLKEANEIEKNRLKKAIKDELDGLGQKKGEYGIAVLEKSDISVQFQDLTNLQESKELTDTNFKEAKNKLEAALKKLETGLTTEIKKAETALNSSTNHNPQGVFESAAHCREALKDKREGLRKAIKKAEAWFSTAGTPNRGSITTLETALNDAMDEHKGELEKYKAWETKAKEFIEGQHDVLSGALKVAKAIHALEGLSNQVESALHFGISTSSFAIAHMKKIITGFNGWERIELNGIDALKEENISVTSKKTDTKTLKGAKEKAIKELVDLAIKLRIFLEGINKMNTSNKDTTELDNIMSTPNTPTTENSADKYTAKKTATAEQVKKALEKLKEILSPKQASV